jgi:flavodoxin
MNVLVVYDSQFGNTEKVARAIGQALSSGSAVEVKHIDQSTPDMLEAVDLLIVGSPTQGFRPTKPVTGLLEALPRGALQGKKVAGFDTRIDTQTMDSAVLGFFVDKGGYAAKHIARGLERAGGSLTVQPEGFYVEDKEGPLKQGELERAAAWAEELVRNP